MGPFFFFSVPLRVLLLLLHPLPHVADAPQTSSFPSSTRLSPCAFIETGRSCFTLKGQTVETSRSLPSQKVAAPSLNPIDEVLDHQLNPELENSPQQMHYVLLFEHRVQLFFRKRARAPQQGTNTETCNFNPSKKILQEAYTFSLCAV